MKDKIMSVANITMFCSLNSQLKDMPTLSQKWEEISMKFFLNPTNSLILLCQFNAKPCFKRRKVQEKHNIQKTKFMASGPITS